MVGSTRPAQTIQHRHSQGRPNHTYIGIPGGDENGGSEFTAIGRPRLYVGLTDRATRDYFTSLGANYRTYFISRY